MKTKNEIKEELTNQLDKINNRLEILELIEKKLYKIKELAKKIINEDLDEKEIQNINDKAKKLEREIDLLNQNPTELS